MDIKPNIQETKNIISGYLQTYLKQTVLPQVSPVSKWGNDAVVRILNMAIQGKMLRSHLIFLSNTLFSSKENSDTLVKTAAAMELFQTGLLIHDDIMDQDDKRRGSDSMHAQYQKLFEHDGIKNSRKSGESFGICIGDMSFFLASHVLSQIKTPDLGSRLQSIFYTELANVCASQMQDVYGGNTQKQLTVENILSIYTYKTGRYSCGLPLVAGALIAGAQDQTMHHLWKLGTGLGILFQIKDDKLNLFGDSKQTGKPISSDIREGKQTLYYCFLMNKSTEGDKNKLQHIFGNPNLSPDDITYVKKQITDLHVDSDIHGIVKKQEKMINETIAHLPIAENKRFVLIDFIDYLKNRNS